MTRSAEYRKAARFVIRRVRRHLIEREQRIQQLAPPPVAVGYDAGDLSVLFGGAPQ